MKRRKQGAIQINAGTLIVIGIVLLLAWWMFGGALTPGQIQPPTQIQKTVTQLPFQNYNIGFTYQEQNAISGASVSTSSPVYAVYHSNGRRLSQVSTLYGELGTTISSGSTATKFAVNEADGDFLFVNIDTGTAHYPDPAAFLKANPAFTAAKWIPVSSATVPELVAELQISKLGAPNYNIDPSISIQLLIPCIPDDLAASLSSPADQDSIGTTANTDVYVEWELTNLSAGEAFAIARLWITSNQTTAYMEVQDVQIISSSKIVTMNSFQDVGTSLTISSAYSTAGTASGVTQFWRYWPSDEDVSTDYTNTLLIPRSSSDADSIKIKVHAKVSFTAATDAVTINCNLRLVSAANGLQSTVSDTVVLGG
jgi:hypothetical protein